MALALRLADDHSILATSEEIEAALMLLETGTLENNIELLQALHSILNEENETEIELPPLPQKLAPPDRPTKKRSDDLTEAVSQLRYSCGT